jgi:hypothetical protein
MKASFWLAASRSVVLMRSRPRINSLPRSFAPHVPNDVFDIGFGSGSPPPEEVHRQVRIVSPKWILTDVPQPIVSNKP